jgi:hypothetical protein
MRVNQTHEHITKKCPSLCSELIEDDLFASSKSVVTIV